MEILKLGLSIQINSDADMYDPETKGYAMVRNSDLIEELGQVQFVFSDKTGTLTCNKMEFMQCLVNGTVWGRYGNYGTGDEPTLDDTLNKIKNNKDSADGQALREYFRFLAICHSVVADTDKVTGELLYNASSPDELALVLAGKRMSFTYVEKTNVGIKIADPEGRCEEFQAEVELPFDSTRKRMSYIYKERDGNYWAYTKGADNVMVPRLKID